MSLFKEQGNYTDEATALANEVEGLLRPILRRCIAQGLNSREVAYVMLDSVHMSEIIERRVLRKKVLT